MSHTPISQLRGRANTATRMLHAALHSWIWSFLGPFGHLVEIDVGQLLGVHDPLERAMFVKSNGPDRDLGPRIDGDGSSTYPIASIAIPNVMTEIEAMRCMVTSDRSIRRCL